MQQNDNTRLDSRVSRLESEIESLAQSVTSLSNSMGRMQENISAQISSLTTSFNSSIEKLGQKFAERTTTDWGKLATVASVAVTVIVIIGAMALKPYDVRAESDEKVNKLRYQILAERINGTREAMKLPPIGEVNP